MNMKIMSVEPYGQGGVTSRVRAGSWAPGGTVDARPSRRGADQEGDTEVADEAVTDQELVAHVFVRPDGPDAAAADRLVRGMWDRFVDLCGAAEPVAADWAPVAVPPRLAAAADPPAAAGASPVLAAVQDRGGRVQALPGSRRDVLRNAHPRPSVVHPAPGAGPPGGVRNAPPQAGRLRARARALFQRAGRHMVVTTWPVAMVIVSRGVKPTLRYRARLAGLDDSR
jgi:hypothetical protein